MRCDRPGSHDNVLNSDLRRRRRCRAPSVTGANGGAATTIEAVPVSTCHRPRTRDALSTSDGSSPLTALSAVDPHFQAAGKAPIATTR